MDSVTAAVVGGISMNGGIGSVAGAFFGAIIEGQYISLSILVRVIYAVVVPAVLARKTERKK